MTRLERAEEAARLKAEGLNGLQIAARLGISKSYAYELLTDPDGSKVAERKRQYYGTCVDCGAPTAYRIGGAAERCVRCFVTQNDERNARIIEAWERGDAAPVIAKREGVTAPTVMGAIEHNRRRKGRLVSLHRHRDRELWPLIERRWNDGAALKEIAVECETSPASVSNMMQHMRKEGVDLPHRPGGGQAGHPEHVRRRAIQLYVEGLSSEAVAATLGVAGSSVRRWVHRSGGSCRPPGRRRKVAA